MKKDYYDILGVPNDASQDAIKKAYRKLAHQYHPDKAGGNEEKFKTINEAYQVLGNGEKRKQYDQFGQTFEGASGGEGFQWQDFARRSGPFGDGFQTGDVRFDFGDLSDVFGEFFGSGGRGRGSSRQRRTRGQDIHVAIEIEFLDAISGVKKSLELYLPVRCSHCRGDGAEPGSQIATCAVCNGLGQVKTTQRTILGTIQTVTTCERCQGEGKSFKQQCHECKGSGVTKAKKIIDVEIPTGIEHGHVMQLKESGEAGQRGARAGDLLVEVRVKKHPLFQRNGSDILSTQEISFAKAALGGSIEVVTVDGTVSLKILEGTPSGKMFRLRGKGAPVLQHRGRGDHLVKIIVKIPTRLTRRQKELLREFEQEDS